MGQVLQILQGAPKVKKGDTVVVSLDKETVKAMQFQHGGWADGMERYLGKKGKVHKIDSDGDVVIKYNTQQQIIYNPDVVAKILSPGDSVRISDNEKKAQFLQQKNGEWNPKMKKILGNKAKVKRILPNYDVAVSIDGDIWRLNPLLCTVIKKSSDDTPSSSSSSSSSSGDDDDDDDDSDEGFLKSSMKGSFYMDKFGPNMESDSMDELALHLDVYREEEKGTEFLLDAGIDINKVDSDGDTALHIAVMKKNQQITRLLVERGANLNILNKKKVAPIHIAVWKRSLECVKELKNCDINIKNKDGNTPLILATMKKEYEILDHILTYQDVDLTRKNKTGFSALHLAAKTGDVKVLEKLLEKRSDIVDMQKIDGYTALHLSTLNDNFEAAKFLIQKANAKLNIRTITQETPLHLAAQKKNFDIVRLLVSEGADINAQDSNGNTSLHLAINKEKGIETFLEMSMQLSSDKSPDAEKIVIYLVKNGASLLTKNEDGETPLDMITDDKLKAELQKKEESSSHVEEEMLCLMCPETKKLVKFQPCGHMKLCIDCNKVNIQANKCMECRMEITEKIEPETEEEKWKKLFKLRDRVRISRKDLFMKQEAKDNPEMKELPNKIGTVTSIGEDAKIHVKFEEKEYEILPEMLTKVFSFRDKIEVIKDVQLVKKLQTAHAEGTENMDEIVGKNGIVVEEGTTLIGKFDTKLYYLNPLVCVWLSEPKQDTADNANENCCVNCGKKTDEMIQLQCGHMYCNDCNHLRKCKFC